MSVAKTSISPDPIISGSTVFGDRNFGIRMLDVNRNRYQIPIERIMRVTPTKGLLRVTFMDYTFREETIFVHNESDEVLSQIEKCFTTFPATPAPDISANNH
jgi:hypothetical protein